MLATAAINSVPMIALGWKDKMVLAICGTTQEGESHKKNNRYRVPNDRESSEIL